MEWFKLFETHTITTFRIISPRVRSLLGQSLTLSGGSLPISGRDDITRIK